MTAPSADRIRLSDPAELIAALPHLLGFHPHDSIVLLALHGTTLGLTLRADLVDTEHAALLAEQLLLLVARQRPTGVALVVVGGGTPTADSSPPHRPLVDSVTAALAEAGLPLVHALWATATAGGAQWCCFDDPLCGGSVPDPATTPLAAATVAAGAVTFNNREELAELLSGEDPAALHRRATLLRDADAEHPMSPELRARRFSRIVELHRDAAAGRLELTDIAVVEVASALCDFRVRDACLSWCTGPDAAAAERLWLALVRATPAPERAEPAALLALAAYLRGDGALAGLALDTALQAHPDHSFSGLLRQALSGGIPPDVIRMIATDAVDDGVTAPRRSPRRRSRRRRARRGR